MAQPKFEETEPEAWYRLDCDLLMEDWVQDMPEAARWALLSLMGYVKKHRLTERRANQCVRLAPSVAARVWNTTQEAVKCMEQCAIDAGFLRIEKRLWIFTDVKPFLSPSQIARLKAKAMNEPQPNLPGTPEPEPTPPANPRARKLIPPDGWLMHWGIFKVAYPTPPVNNEKAGEDCYRRLLAKGADPQEILAGVQRLALAVKEHRIEKAYVPSWQAFLKYERWNEASWDANARHTPKTVRKYDI